jgi:signal transduction histidine kinase
MTMSKGKGPSGPASVEDFLDIAGHELRIPITSLKGQVQLMQRRLRREEGRERDLGDLDKVAYQIERLNHDLDIYLAAVHIAQRRLQVFLEPLDLVPVLTRVVKMYAAGSATHIVRFECNEESVQGNWDKRRIEQVVGVLIANAFKYSQGGEVLVRLWALDGVAHIEVCDQGLGVPSKERAKIFQAYTHASNAANHGVGLGLYVARAIVRRMGGRIGVRPRPGGGSQFWFELPFQQAGRIKRQPVEISVARAARAANGVPTPAGITALGN